MSDALCGPANPLQQFKQQSQFDRTLQQDRLTSRPSPARGFRSADPNAGLLDPEFEAFQAGVPPSELAHLPAFHQQPPSLAGPSQAPSWANDFQRMHISSPPSFQQQPFAPQTSHAGSGWAQGFQEHIAQAAPRAPSSAPSPQAFQYMARYGTNGYQNSFAQPNFAQPLQSKGKEAVTEQFDDAAFERAFDQARDALMAEEKPADNLETEELPYVHGTSTGNDETMFEEAGQTTTRAMEAIDDLDMGLHDFNPDTAFEPFDVNEFPKHSRLEITREDVPTTQNEAEQLSNDDDALAQTAQELLEKVEHNQTDKFRNSQFLGLMRRLRDREVKVEGDKMVETAATASTLENKSVHFDNTEQIPHPIDSTPISYTIPTNEQDHDPGRHTLINPNDGQEVVDLLNKPELNLTSPFDDGTTTASTHDIGTSNTTPDLQSSFPEGIFYADLRQRGWEDKMGSRPFEVDWERWDVRGPAGGRGGQPPPGMP